MSLGRIVNVTMDNLDEYGFYCTSNPKYDGYQAKKKWFKENLNKSLVLKQMILEDGKAAGFIEYIDGENAWRPVIAEGYLFIHCIMVGSKSNRNQDVASGLIQDCIDDARNRGKNGVVVMTSDGTWIADKRVFLKNGFEVIAEKERYELLLYAINETDKPSFLDWEKNRDGYKGWNMLIAHQCPMQYRAMEDLPMMAKDNNIRLKIKELKKSEEARNSPAGFGVMTILKDEEVVADHYVSKTRFRNIIQKKK